MKIKVSEATELQLDWMVTKIKGEVNLEYYFPMRFRGAHIGGKFNYTTNWAQGGPIIEREEITVLRCFGKWRAEKEDNEGDTAWAEDGPTPLIATMRCYVASKLGDEVEVPGELK